MPRRRKTWRKIPIGDLFIDMLADLSELDRWEYRIDRKTGQIYIEDTWHGVRHPTVLYREN